MEMKRKKIKKFNLCVWRERRKDREKFSRGSEGREHQI